MGLLLQLLNSAGVGSLLGWIGGAVNRHLDLKAKAMDHAHELKLRDADARMLELEWQNRAAVASIERETAIETAGYAALGASYANDRATYGNKWIDGARGLIRPLLTVVFTAAALFVMAAVLETHLDKLTAATAVTLIDWLLFTANMVIGWWFANRPAKPRN